MALGDPRECGYSLMALLAATVVGEDHRKSAKDLLDHILKTQQADGQWLSSDGGGAGRRVHLELHDRHPDGVPDSL